MEGGETLEPGYLLLRVSVPELNVQKSLQFPSHQLVWEVKQQCLAALPKVISWYTELKESFNYGLFCPPVNGKAGKFLCEERRLGDYPFNGPVGYLELKYKRRIYKQNLEEKQLKSLHTRTNLRRFIEYVNNGQVEKVTKMCSKGLDPNFHCQDSGETPLTMATAIKGPGKMLMALVNGGALLDYRTRDGVTALHRAVERNSLEALTTLLELGASPNYKDAKGLTPLYWSVTHPTDPLICEGLLHDRAFIGSADLQGWQEVHQACRLGLVQHLEQLLFYGADMNSRNASGNTPLHVCAVNSQDSCARLLLFRGAQADSLNYANQTPYQVAVIAGNLDLAEVIQNHRPDDVVPFRDMPRYNPRRRSVLVSPPSSTSSSVLSHYHSMSPGSLGNLGHPPSPSPSDRSYLAPFSSASSSMSEGSSNSHRTSNEETASYLTDKSLGDTSDVVSDSSGIGTSNSDTTTSITLPGTTVISIENYSSSEPGHLRFSQGDIIEVTGSADSGLLEGTLQNGETGLFPAHCVQEAPTNVGMVNRRSSSTRQVSSLRESISAAPSMTQSLTTQSMKHFATAPRNKKQLPGEPRTVVLHRGRRGFGFVLRGAKATSPLLEQITNTPPHAPHHRFPALQYLDDVDERGVADMAGLKKGDFILAINGEDVSNSSHEHVVDLIRRSGDLVSMTVVSAGNLTLGTGAPAQELHPNPHHYATLPRKPSNPGSTGTLGRSPAPLPPRRDPKTTLTVGRARARSMVVGGLDEDNLAGKSSSAESLHQQQGHQPRTASIRARPTSSRITAAELEELFARQSAAANPAARAAALQHSQGNLSQPSSPARAPRVYASVAEMKRNKGKMGGRVRFSTAGVIGPGGELHRDFHSTPDLAVALGACLASGPSVTPGPVSTGSAAARQHRSEEELHRAPPPNHPPPPPPAAGHTGHIVKVELNKENGDYGTLPSKLEAATISNGETIASSFKPAAKAKLYASPEDVKSVGFRCRTLPNRSLVRKTQSLRSNSSTFKPATTPTGVAGGSPNANPYAQPIQRTANGGRPKSASIPPIPDPDYSLSEAESDNDEDREKTVIQVNNNQEGSGNSSTSSGSIPHSFSVDEIQKVRTQLKSSKSYPNDFVHNEDGDNSSSGVSSDQEVPGGECRMSETKMVSSTTTLPRAHHHQPRSNLTRNAVSLAQLPPPMESESDTDIQPPPSLPTPPLAVPPPPEFTETASTIILDQVLAPPPQFSDSKLVTRVRIVGALPKPN